MQWFERLTSSWARGRCRIGSLHRELACALSQGAAGLEGACEDRRPVERAATSSIELRVNGGRAAAGSEQGDLTLGVRALGIARGSSVYGGVVGAPFNGAIRLHQLQRGGRADGLAALPLDEDR